MSKNKNLGGGEMHEESTELDLRQRLAEEITILRIEGSLFCFDPREARRRTGKLTRTLMHADGIARPVSIEIHPTYGQPSVLAYKIVQAIFVKMTEQGYPYTNVATFTQRELARLVGRDAWGGRDSQQLYHAMMQLQRTGITCHMQNKDTKEHLEFNFYFLNETLFSKRENAIRSCMVKIADPIVHSLNRRHIAFFNIQKLNTLDTIGMVLYKRIFFHFSNLYQPNVGRTTLILEKDYVDVCTEWLGGLKPEKYASRVMQQLGKHLEGLKATKLIRRYEVKARANGKGLKIVFHPGDGFFEDYLEYYVGEQRKRKESQREALSVRHIQKPFELVAYFHERMGRKDNTFLEKETAQASDLLEHYSEVDIRELIDYAVKNAPNTGYKMQYFGAVVATFLEPWEGERSTFQARERRQAAITACPLCDSAGYIQVKDQSGAFRAQGCSVLRLG
jgi:Replication initiator protein A